MGKLFLAMLFCSFVILHRLFVLGSQPSCSESEKEALSKFKAGLIDPSNRLASWDPSYDCCRWSGITCDNETGYVVKLDLRNPYGYEFLFPTIPRERYNYIHWNLSGKIDPVLQDLKYLHHFDISGNTFNGIPIPDFLGSFKELKYLNLSYAGFCGMIPSTLGNLSFLEVLDVNSMMDVRPTSMPYLSVKNIGWLEDLSRLKHLDMNQVDLSLVSHDWMYIMNSLSSLTELHLSGCGLSEIPKSLYLVNFTSLRILDLSHNLFDSEFPNWITNISTLVSLDLSWNSWNFYGEFLSGFQRLSHFEELRMRGTFVKANCSKLFEEGWENIRLLSLFENQLYGELPISIGNISSITSLDLSGNLIEGEIPKEIGDLHNLKELQLSGNKFVGRIPEEIGNLLQLEILDLSINEFENKMLDFLGHLHQLKDLYLHRSFKQVDIIDEWLCYLKNLGRLDLSSNMLVGPVPTCLGGLSSLELIDLANNKLNGTILETHFESLNKLRILDFSSNSLKFQISQNWTPPFQVEYISLSLCHLGPYFPSWLHSQKYLQFVDLSYTEIGGNIPHWFWNLGPQSQVSLSDNMLIGHLPHFANMDSLILSNNQFSGPIPNDVAKKNPKLRNFLASNNQISGSIPSNFGKLVSLTSLDLSKNKLSGVIPSNLGECRYLEILDLSNNYLSGSISWPVVLLRNLRTLHLGGNKLSGKFPLSLRNCTSLQILDLSDNSFVGSIPGWIGGSLSSLMVLSLRSNMFNGEIPWQLSKLRFLQVLDVANNHLHGPIPKSFGSFEYMKENHTRGDFKFGKETTGYYQQWLVMSMKDQLVAYDNINVSLAARYYQQWLIVSMKDQLVVYYNISVSLVVSMDLSNNNFSREIPHELTNLSGLVVLNLSGNHLSGQIPNSIGNLKQLQSLDLSRNQVFGLIPSSIADLTFLSHLNFSHNNLSGRIPSGPPQLESLNDSSIYAWNDDLCGSPLQKSCTVDKQFQDPGLVEGEEDEVHEATMVWFYIGLGQGFIAGFWGFVGLLLFKRSWRIALFRFFHRIVD